jgi:hypothetical protein
MSKGNEPHSTCRYPSYKCLYSISLTPSPNALLKKKNHWPMRSQGPRGRTQQSSHLRLPPHVRRRAQVYCAWVRVCAWGGGRGRGGGSVFDRYRVGGWVGMWVGGGGEGPVSVCLCNTHRHTDKRTQTHTDSRRNTHRHTDKHTQTHTDSRPCPTQTDIKGFEEHKRTHTHTHTAHPRRARVVSGRLRISTGQRAQRPLPQHASKDREVGMTATNSRKVSTHTHTQTQDIYT